MQRPSMEEILSDLADEAAALDTLLADIDEEVWFRSTPAEGWDIRDTVAHLADTDDIAYDCVTGGPRDLLTEAQDAGSGEGMTQRQVEKGRSMTPERVLAWWRASNARLLEALRGCDPGDRIPWGPNKLAATSFATARLMEAWAHGLDCFAAADVEPVDTTRLRHVAFLGLRALSYAFTVAGVEAPGPIRLELEAPDGDTWQIGPADAPTVIRGTASDWCRVATQRDRANERDRLTGEGPYAEVAIEHARAFL